jgi:hypothetical protein
MSAADARFGFDRLCYPLHTFLLAVTQWDERIFHSGRNRQVCRAAPLWLAIVERALD